jgi:predicted ATPase/DNA-binding winged helix-turn-helix (wHTH) protein
MGTAPDNSDRFHFGPFEFRPAERRLLCQGTPLVLGDRAMDILQCLLEHHGDVLSNEELLASAWPGINVEPVTLRVQISGLRKALAEADPGVLYVSNIASRGYCFVASARREANKSSNASTPAKVEWPALPPALSRMIGRETVVDALEQTITKEHFVTLVGPGGIGKTTVALALADRMSRAFDGDVAFVDLAMHKGDDSVVAAVAATLRLNRLDGDPVAEIVFQLRSRRCLLILDSCEHVIAGAAALAEAVWQGAPKNHIVATSREPLMAQGEQVFHLTALETPPRSETLSFEEVCGYPAAQLFVERVAAAGGRIDREPADALLVADICRKLDGIPLAIELAASRVDAFGLEKTRALLDSRLQLSWPARHTAVPRHITLNATLDWSYDLLAPDEARLLRVLSTFAGTFTFDAARAVADDALRAVVPHTLAGLVAKSLVSVDRTHTPFQYRLLDTTRQYARLKLEAAGELPAVAARHAGWALDDLRNLEAQLRAAPTRERLENHASRIPDALSALDWSRSENGDRSFTVPLTLASSVWGGTFSAGQECRRRIEAALSTVEPGSRDEMKLDAVLAEVLLDSSPYDMPRAEIAATRALELATKFDDPPSQFLALWCLWNTHILTRPNISKAQEQARLYHEFAGLRGGPSHQVAAELMVGISALVDGNLSVARAASDRVETLGATRTLYPNTARVSLLWLDGLPDSAAAAARVNLGRARATGGAPTEAAVLADSCGALALNVGDLKGAKRYAEMIDDCVDRGAWLSFRTWAEVSRVTIAAWRGDAGPGRSFLSRALPTECGHPRFAPTLAEFARRLGSAGAEDVARDLADRLLQRVEATGERWIWSEVQRVRGELTPDAAEAEALFEAALAVAQKQGARAWALRAATSLARRRRSVAEDVLAPLLASFTEGAETQDHIEARSVLAEWRLDLR